MQVSSSDESMEEEEEEYEYEEREMALDVAIKVMTHFESTRLPYGKPKSEFLTNLTYGITASSRLLDDEKSVELYGKSVENFVSKILGKSLERITENVYFTEDERRLATQVLVDSASIFIRLKRHDLEIPKEFTSALAADASVPFFRGKPSYMNPRIFENGVGAATKREMLRIMTSSGVLDVMLSILVDKKWCGASLAGKILYTFVHANSEGILQKGVALDVAKKFMHRMSTLSEDDTKLRIKANQISLTKPFYALEKLCGGMGNKLSTLFWLKEVDLKYYMNDNVTERLFALGDFAWFSRKRANHRNAGLGNHWINNERYVAWLKEHKVLEILFQRNRVEEELIKKGTSLLEYVAGMRLERVPGACPDTLLWTMWMTASELGTKSKWIMVLRALAKVLVILGNRVVSLLLSRDDFREMMKNETCRERAQKLLLLLYSTKRSASSLELEGGEVATKLLWNILWYDDLDGSSVKSNPSVAMLRLLGVLINGNEIMVKSYALHCVCVLQSRKNSNASLLAVKVFSVLLRHIPKDSLISRNVLAAIREKIESGNVLELLKLEFFQTMKNIVDEEEDDDDENNVDKIMIESRLELICQAVHTFQLNLNPEDVESVWNVLSSRREIRSRWLTTLLEDLHTKTRDVIFDRMCVCVFVCVLVYQTYFFHVFSHPLTSFFSLTPTLLLSTFS